MLALIFGFLAVLNQQTWQQKDAHGTDLYEQGRVREAIAVLEEARQDARAAHAPDLETTHILDTLGACYEQAGRLNEALSLFERGLKIRQSQLSSPNEAIATSLTNKSSVYWALVKPDEALASAQQAKKMWEDLGQTGRREYLVALNNEITAELLRGNVREVAPVVTTARALYVQNLPQSDPMLPRSLAVLAAAYKAMGKYAEGSSVGAQAVAIAEQQHSGAALLAKLKSNLGDLRMMEGRWSEAERLLLDSVATPAPDLPSDLLDRACAYHSLGSVERLLGKYEQAEAADKEALQLLGDTPGQAAVVRGEVLNELAILSEVRNKWKDAERYLKQAKDTLEANFGAGHPSVSAIYSDLATFYMHAHQYGRAEDLYRKVLAAETAVFPADHPAIARDLNNLGTLAFKRGRFDEAQPLFARATAMMERTLGPAHADTALAEANLANTLVHLKEYEDARYHYARAIATMGQCWGEDDPRLMGVLNGFEMLLRSQAEPGEAEKLVTRMERIRVKQAIANERRQAAGAS